MKNVIIFCFLQLDIIHGILLNFCLWLYRIFIFIFIVDVLSQELGTCTCNEETFSLILHHKRFCECHVCKTQPYFLPFFFLYLVCKLKWVILWCLESILIVIKTGCFCLIYITEAIMRRILMILYWSNKLFLLPL